MSPTQLRNIPVGEMTSERMLMPNWAKYAATVLSDEQIALEQIKDGPRTPAHAKPILDDRKMGETVGGTVSRKGKFGFTCESCGWVPKKGDDPDWVTTKEFVGDVKSKMFAAHWPERCKKCKSRMKRWTCAARKYDQLEILRTLEGRHCLRFMTLTRETWNVNVRPEDGDLWEMANVIKKKAVRQFKNWRDRNKYWKSREAKRWCYQDFEEIRHELPGRLHQQESTLAISPVRRLVILERRNPNLIQDAWLEKPRTHQFQLCMQCMLHHQQ
jgi:hypothetical protein